MFGNFNTSDMLKQSYFKECFGYELHQFSGSDITLAKREFSKSVQAALRSGLNSRDLQAILDTILDKAKEVQ